MLYRLIAYFLLKPDSLTFQKLFYLCQWKLFKNDEKCFLFHHKRSLFKDI